MKREELGTCEKMYHFEPHEYQDCCVNWRPEAEAAAAEELPKVVLDSPICRICGNHTLDARFHHAATERDDQCGIGAAGLISSVGSARNSGMFTTTSERGAGMVYPRTSTSTPAGTAEKSLASDAASREVVERASEKWATESEKLNPDCGCEFRGNRQFRCSYHEGGRDGFEAGWQARAALSTPEVARELAKIAPVWFICKHGTFANPCKKCEAPAQPEYSNPSGSIPDCPEGWVVCGPCVKHYDSWKRYLFPEASIPAGAPTQAAQDSEERK